MGQVGVPAPNLRRQRWIVAREQELLDTSYFHIVFAVPHQLNVLALDNPRLFYDLLFTASAFLLVSLSETSRFGFYGLPSSSLCRDVSDQG